ncbi:MAG: adenosylmethionine--8-amino-7-oxononanoate transaminase [Syntrophobacteraceae bacterium]
MMQPITEHYWTLDRTSIWHPYTKQSALKGDPFPIIMRGEGVYLYDSEGRRYTDAISSWWACNLGHSNPRLVSAITRQAGELQHSILGNLSHPGAAELASKLVELFPGGDRRVLFASDGASAVEAALRIAVQYRHNRGEGNRHKFVALENGYHGDTIGAMSIGYLPSFHAAYRSMLFPVYQAEAPYCAECRHGGSPYTCNLECFASMERIIEEHAEELAAVIVEPLCQGAAGMRIYSFGYLRRLSELCREHSVLLIVDEIAMGFGRTGKMFAFEHAGIDPDIVCVGKSLSGGYLPISAAIVKGEIFETFADEPEDHTLYHGHTFAGNPIAAAASIECLQIYKDENIVGRAEMLGMLLAEKIEPFKEIAGITNVRSLGMVGAFDLTNSGNETGTSRAQRLRLRLMQQGILMRPLDNTVYVMLPLVVSEEVLRETMDTLYKTVKEVKF